MTLTRALVTIRKKRLCYISKLAIFKLLNATNPSFHCLSSSSPSQGFAPIHKIAMGYNEHIKQFY